MSGRSLSSLLIARSAPAAKPEGMGFKRVEVAGHTSEVVISTDEIGTATGIGKSAAYRAVRTAIDLGFLINNEMRPVASFQTRPEEGCRRSDHLPAAGSGDDHGKAVPHESRRSIVSVVSDRFKTE